MNADAALQKLIDGNARYALTANGGAESHIKVKNHQSLKTQNPFAIILSCSDSRVPVELVFDQGLGDLFVIRVAGNIAAPSQIGSVEFACQQFNTPLIIVLGHSGCGAISATVDSLINDINESGETNPMSPNLAAIVDQVAPSASSVIAKNKSSNREELLYKTMRANVAQSVKQLELGSSIISDLIKQKQLTIVGAEYSLESGKIEFYL